MVVAVILTLLLRLISIKWKLTLPELKHTKEP
jgi:uncharacterized membrane protein YeiH